MGLIHPQTGEIEPKFDGADIIYLDNDYIFLKGFVSSEASSVEIDGELRKLEKITSLSINKEEYCFYEICGKIQKE